MSVPSLELNDGHKIPQIGLGLWQVKDQTEFNPSFTAGIEAGYRHFDSAQAYDNEQFLGEAWKASGLKRDEIFLTTKIAVQNFGENKSKRAFAESLENLQTDYVDLLLLHFPVTILRKKTWRTVEEAYKAGQARSIGVSNYTIRHLEEMKDYAEVLPDVNQVELHVFLQQPELIKYCQDNGIVVEAYSPLAHAKAMNNAVVAKIAAKHGKTYAQVMLRWLIQQDLVVLPKSVTPSRVKENIDIFDFELDSTDLTELATQDQDLRTCWSPVHVP
ncbi:aldo/keto reductase [Candidatus Saccharibacteria bacterium CG_4_10_14_0_2_um_filter_52_9]|nr:MAG: aldo/keto reductase [Candidatus Saccharibacteria bacterium CG_4_10_14_0_2_um_filter_52_9]